MNYYQRHLGDYAKDTGHLSALEHGVYTLLLDRYYSTESAIPQADAYKVARARTKEEQAATEGVLREFFKLIDGHWHHSYADRVIAKAHEKSGKAAESAAKRWHSERNANAVETHNGSHTNGHAKAMLSNNPLTNTPIAKEEKHLVRRAAARFEEFWKVFPSSSAVAKKTCVEIWRSKNLDAKADDIIRDVTDRSADDTRWLRGYVPNARTYLSQERWNDSWNSARMEKANGKKLS